MKIANDFTTLSGESAGLNISVEHMEILYYKQKQSERERERERERDVAYQTIRSDRWAGGF